MANHKSAEKRARQTIKRTEKNRRDRSEIRTAARSVLEAKPEEKSAKLSEAFSIIQKGKNVLPKNKIRRMMARLSKAVARKESGKAA